MFGNGEGMRQRGRGGGSRRFSNQETQRSRVNVGEKLKQAFEYSEVKILHGNEIKGRLGKSFRGNEIWVTLLVINDPSDSKFVDAVISQTEKFHSVFQVTF